MRFAILRGKDLLRYELDDKGPLEPGAKRYPVETDPKPTIDPHTEYLDSYAELDPLRQVMRVKYMIGLQPPKPDVPEGATVIIQQVPAQIDLTATDQQIAALQAKLAEMQAAQDAQAAAQSVGALMAAIQHGTPAEAEAAAAELQRVAAAAGMSVEQLAAGWAAKRDQTIATLKGAA